MRVLISVLLLVPGLALSAPFLVSDPDPTGAADKCSYIDGTATQVDTPIVVTPPALTGACHIDLSSFTVGVHNLQVSFKSTTWGVESTKTPFTLTKPASGTAGPTGLKVSPQ